MINFKCKNCSNTTNYFTQTKGTQTGLYCGNCGRWIKWLSKEELRLYNVLNKPKQEEILPQELVINGIKYKMCDNKENNND